MASTTSNKYGKISVSDRAVALCALHAARGCYGVVAVVAKNIWDKIACFFKGQHETRGVKVASVDNRIFIELFVILKEGVREEAVVDSLCSVVTYAVEDFTGMLVKSVKVKVLGTRK